MNENVKQNNFTQEDFQFVQMNEKIFDKKFETKAVGYFGDALRRFAKNKTSLVAFFVLIIIVLMAIFVPMGNPDEKENRQPDLQFFPPRIPILENFGITDGTADKNAIILDKIISINDPRIYSTDGISKDKLSEYIYLEYIGDGLTMADLEAMAYDHKDPDGNDVKKVDITYNVYKHLNAPRWDNKASYNDYLVYQEAGIIMKDENGNERVIFDTANLGNYRIDCVKKMIIPYIKNSANKSDPEYAILNEIVTVMSKSSKEKFNELIQQPEFADKLAVLDRWTENYYKANIDPTWTKEKAAKCYVLINPSLANPEEIYHYFGTDISGRDVWTLLWQGTRLSLLIGLFVAIVSIVVGVVWGAISGYYGGTVDIVMERFTEILTGIPWIVIMTFTKMLLYGKIPTELIVAISLVLTSWTGTAGMVRAQMYRYKNREYVLASRTLGAKDLRLIFKHILPNALGTIVTGCVLVIPSAIFFESSVAYLGLGIDAGTISVGNLLSAGREAGITTHPHLTVFPSLLIAILMISFNMFGNGLRDALNPSLRGSE